MLHDIGLAKVDEEELERWRRTGELSDAVADHVNKGFGMVRGKIKPSAAAVVLHHHQRYNGTGYPYKTLLDGSERPLDGDEIHIFARIVGLADEFDRKLTGSDGFREREAHDLPRVRVLKELWETDEDSPFDPFVLRALMNVCPPYPPGSMVGLSTGMDAVVVSWNELDPCRPVVRRIDPDDPEQEFEEQIDLAKMPDVSIVKADDQDVGDFNFGPKTPHDLDLKGATIRMANRAQELEQSA